jgi:hypothetical protein
VLNLTEKKDNNGNVSKENRVKAKEREEYLCIASL